MVTLEDRVSFPRKNLDEVKHYLSKQTSLLHFIINSMLSSGNIDLFFLKVIEDSAQKQIRDTLDITRYRVSGWTEIGLEGKI